MLAAMDLESGEHVIFEGHPSWRSIFGFYVKGLLVVVLGAAAVGVATMVADDEVNTGLVTAVAIGLIAIVLVSLLPILFEIVRARRSIPSGGRHAR